MKKAHILFDTYLTLLHWIYNAAAKSLQSCPTVRPHRQQPTRLPHPWDSPGKNTGVGYHFLLQCMKVKSESEVAQSCPILSDPMDCSLPGSSAHGIFQARVLEWGVIASAKSKLILSCLLYYPNTGGGGRENPQLLLWIFYPGIWPLSFPFLEAHTK